ncbi:MAG TPA: alpha/beta hydrolase [Jatrophihabitantaceae bacterium]|jgi:pimeloyl-ACP methyl ester carboxylesterase|nr:alpha/beta hydrolase [Jatrophihabitantaceae bacterium]
MARRRAKDVPAHTLGMPTMLIWGERDSVLPVEHAHRAHAAMPGSRLEVCPEHGHFPFRTDPARFVGFTTELRLESERSAT